MKEFPLTTFSIWSVVADVLVMGIGYYIKESNSPTCACTALACPPCPETVGLYVGIALMSFAVFHYLMTLEFHLSKKKK